MYPINLGEVQTSDAWIYAKWNSSKNNPESLNCNCFSNKIISESWRVFNRIMLLIFSFTAGKFTFEIWKLPIKIFSKNVRLQIRWYKCTYHYLWKPTHTEHITWIKSRILEQKKTICNTQKVLSRESFLYWSFYIGIRERNNSR